MRVLVSLLHTVVGRELREAGTPLDTVVQRLVHRVDVDVLRKVRRARTTDERRNDLERDNAHQEHDNKANGSAGYLRSDVGPRRISVGEWVDVHPMAARPSLLALGTRRLLVGMARLVDGTKELLSLLGVQAALRDELYVPLPSHAAPPRCCHTGNWVTLGDCLALVARRRLGH